MIEESIYAEPRVVENLDECWFYHTMDLPEYGLVQGDWDLRAGVETYLGGVELAGKRVLDVGTASGFLCFHMERQGAEVVAYDLSDDLPWDVVPYCGGDSGASASERRRSIQNINNSYWLSHRALKSRAKVVYGSVYEIPPEIAPVDASIFGCLLLHVRDPFLALERALRMTRETAVVVEPSRPRVAARILRKLGVPPGFIDSVSRPAAVFMPDFRSSAPTESWWYLPPPLIVEFLGVLGFEDVAVTYHTQPHKGRPSRLYTVVARRTRGSVP